MRRFDDKIVLLTGAASGIGKATVLRMAEEGASIACADVQVEAVEATAKEALESAFPDEMDGGRVVWRPANLDRPENEHFVTDYELTTSSLVLVDMLDGAQQDWNRVDETWELVGDKLAFQAFVEGEALAYLEFGE